MLWKIVFFGVDGRIRKEVIVGNYSILDYALFEAENFIIPKYELSTDVNWLVCSEDIDIRFISMKIDNKS